MKPVFPRQEARIVGLIAVLATGCNDDIVEGTGTEGETTSTSGSATTPSTTASSTTASSTASTTMPDPSTSSTTEPPTTTMDPTTVDPTTDTTSEPPTTTVAPTTDTTGATDPTDPTVATDLTIGTTETTVATEGMTDTTPTTTGETTLVVTDSASSSSSSSGEATGTTGTTTDTGGTTIVDPTNTTTTTTGPGTGSSTGTTGTTGTTGDCPEGDADMDMICDSVDLCDDLIGTHCLEFNVDGSAVFDTYDLETTSVLAPLLDANIIVGVTLVVDSVVVNDACDAMAGTIAKEYDTVVGAFNMWSDDPAANDYLQDEIMAEWLAEWVGPTIRFFALGAGTDPRFEVVFSAGMAPGHLFGFSDTTSYDPVCEDVDIDSTITGTDAVFRVDYHGPLTLEERMTGVTGEYILYPTG